MKEPNSLSLSVSLGVEILAPPDEAAFRCGSDVAVESTVFLFMIPASPPLSLSKRFLRAEGQVLCMLAGFCISNRPVALSILRRTHSGLPREQNRWFEWGDSLGRAALRLILPLPIEAHSVL